MKFKYLGDKTDMQAFGYDFSGGATPDVTAPMAISKLSGNGEFAVVQDGAPVKTVDTAQDELADEAEDKPKRKSKSHLS